MAADRPPAATPQDSACCQPACPRACWRHKRRRLPAAAAATSPAQVGERRASTKTELKTLDPLWNETVAFGPSDIQDAVAGARRWGAGGRGRPGAIAACSAAACSAATCTARSYVLQAARAADAPPACSPPRSTACAVPAAGRRHVSLRVFDWDLVSADDFLGQAELPFSAIDASATGPGAPQWLPLYGWKGGAKSGRKVDAGEIQVAVWMESGGSPERKGEAAPGPPAAVCVGRSPPAISDQHAAAHPAPLLTPPPHLCSRLRAQHAVQRAGHAQASAAGGAQQRRVNAV